MHIVYPTECTTINSPKFAFTPLYDSRVVAHQLQSKTVPEIRKHQLLFNQIKNLADKAEKPSSSNFHSDMTNFSFLKFLTRLNKILKSDEDGGRNLSEAGPR